MTPEQRLELLNQFLLDNDVYGKYYDNVNSLNYSVVDKGIHKFMIGLCHSSHPVSMFNTAFGWSNSPEGYTFWQKISDKWMDKFEYIHR